jgi:hypothetical protein
METTGTTTGGALEARDFKTPDETREFPKGNLKLVRLGNHKVGVGRFEPGWKWSESLRPIAQTELCEATHTLYCLSGTMEILMKDGTRRTLHAGDVAMIPPGHDARVLGKEACVIVDFFGFEEYALPPTRH